MSTLKVNTIQNTSGENNLGSILQVVQSTRTDLISSTSSTYADVLTAAITPTDSSNKVLCMFNTQETCDSGDGNTYSQYLLLRDSTSVFIGDASGSAARGTAGRFGRQSNVKSDAVHIMYMDSPNTTSAITYKVQYRSVRGSSWRVSVGGALRDTFEGDCRTPTSFILMEVNA